MAINVAPFFFWNCTIRPQISISFLPLCFFLISTRVLGQSKSENNPAVDPPLSTPTAVKEIVKHDALETELEFYPFNMVVPNDPVIKNEAMFDYHMFHNEGKLLSGIRFFADVNTHWAKTRDMKDLILYTEFYYGFKHFQIGAETGSVTAQEYLSIGPQFVSYDSKIFRRVALISRILPDYVLGYEFTTQETDILPRVKISSTGMGRIVLPSNQTVIQASVWVSFENIKGIYFGMEYEYNNAQYFNNYRYETNHELFFGIKVELH